MPSKVFCFNRNAFTEYEIYSKIEAGIVLKGYEVKSIRSGLADIKGSYVSIKNNEAWIVNFSIQRIDKNSNENKFINDPKKLLLNKKEILNIGTHCDQKGYTIIPLSVFLSKGKIKVEIALARGLKLYDKRQRIKEKEFERELKKI